MKLALSAASDPNFPGTGAIRGRQKTILLVEDEEVLRELLNRVLSAAGYLVIDAANAESALLRAEQYDGRIELLVSDVVLPDIGGIELFKTLRKSERVLRAVLMSGYGADIVERYGAFPNGAELLPKPFERPVLLSIVNRLLL